MKLTLEGALRWPDDGCKDIVFINARTVKTYDDDVTHRLTLAAKVQDASAFVKEYELDTIKLVEARGSRVYNFEGIRRLDVRIELYNYASNQVVEESFAVISFSSLDDLCNELNRK
jgi:hypothetical protein